MLTPAQIKAIERADIISFDIFDTAIVRSCFHPTDLFDLVQARIRRKGLPCASFKSIRMAAEQRAHSQRAESTLDEIYQSFATLSYLPDASVRQIQELEIMTERSLISARSSVQAIYRLAQSLGKTIIFVSDMYLSSEILASMLQHCGYEQIDSLIVSNEYQASKASGKLWPILKLQFAKARILHFGDNFRADVQNARKAGIEAIYCERIALQAARSAWKSALFPKHSRPQQSVALGLCTKYFAASGPRASGRILFAGDPYTLGYKALGPMVHSFLRELKRYCLAQGIEAIYFLARDARLFFEAAGLLPDLPAIRYLRVSRSALKCLPLSLIDQDLSAIDKLLNADFAPCLLQDFLRFRLGCESQDLEQIDYGDCEPGTVVSSKDLAKIRSVVVANRLIIGRRNQERRRIVERYLKEQGLDGRRKSILVDLGYNGSLQSWLNLVVGQLQGYYLAVFPQISEQLEEGTFQSFLGPPQDKAYTPYSFLKSLPLLESLLAEAQSTVDGYRECSQKGVEPVCREYDDPNSVASKGQIYAGALAYVKELSQLEQQLELDLSLDCASCIRGLHQIASGMRGADRQLLASLAFDNDFAGLKETTVARLEGWSRWFSLGWFHRLTRSQQTAFGRKLMKLQKNPFLFLHDSNWLLFRWLAKFLQPS